VTETPRPIDIPVLKAWNRIFELVACVADNPYNRDRLRDAILELYPGRTEKSVFRGMAIPTLRRLGLIVGFADLIRLSANGKLVNAAHKMSVQLGKRALGTIVYEIDRAEFGFLQEIANDQQWKAAHIVEHFLPKVSAPSQASARERVTDWLGLLGYCDLVTEQAHIISLNHQMAKQVSKDASPNEKSRLFEKLLIPAYTRLVNDSKGMQSHPIEDLRAKVALTILAEHKQILTEKQFDELLVQFPKTGSSYLISFGRPMGADEKLLRFDGKYYQTISIRFFNQ
jgi:hypothetical protein